MHTSQKALLVLLLAGMVMVPAPVVVKNGHGSESHDMTGQKTQDILVEGVLVSFSVMANPEHRKMLRDMKMTEDIEAGTTHNITVTFKDQKTRQSISNAAVSMRVVDPSGKDQIKTLKFESSMNSYGSYFNLTVKGKYQILVLAKYDDRKTTAGIYYEVR